MMLVRGLELGLPMTIIEPVGNPLIDFDADTTQLAFTALVPLQLQSILESTPEKRVILNRMKAILVGGAATSPALEQALQIITSPVYATYGMTETVSHIALRQLNGAERSEVFTALDGVTLGTDTRGCLHITSAATNFERVQTNDVVDLLDKTRFRLLGRADRIINSGGIKVQPERIEEIIQGALAQRKQHADDPIPRLFVAGLPDERLGQRVVVFFEQRARERIHNDEWTIIQEIVRTQLGPFSMPKEMITVAEFAETATGKVDQKATIAQIHYL